jgi:radical SAM protein with 4Fe4S-binding SPASM domain
MKEEKKKYIFNPGYLLKNDKKRFELIRKNIHDLFREDAFLIEEFMIPRNQLDLKSYRSYVPASFILEINFKCKTNCIYCYANRSQVDECSIPIERIKELIKEAKKMRLRSIDLCGGEVFLYENWEMLLRELVDNGFMPYISTKIPLDEKTIRKLKEIGISGIQFSIDTLDKKALKKLLLINDDYKTSLIKSLKWMRQYNLKFAVNSQITSLNQEISGVKNLLDFLLTFENLRSIKLGAIGASLYKSEKNYKKYAPSLTRIVEIQDLLNSYQEKYKSISISFSGYSSVKDILKNYEEKTKFFAERARCTANFNCFVILPDGQVTICEELYFHPQFIIGNVQDQSIEEVWNSEKALGLYNLSKDKISEDSICKSCEQFEPCHRIKGVCWKQILGAYGMDKWGYPDPRCPKAPKPERQTWLV